MALHYMLRNISKSLQVCKTWSASKNQLFKFDSAVRNASFEHTFPNFPKLSSSSCRNLSHKISQSASVICTRNFTVSSMRNEADKAHKGDHTKLWSAERLLAAGLLGVVPAALIFPSQPMDCLLALSLVMHSHWGVEAIVADYVRPIIFGKMIPVIAHALVYVLSISTLTGILFLIFNDCGLSNAIHLLWKL